MITKSSDTFQNRYIQKILNTVYIITVFTVLSFAGCTGSKPELKLNKEVKGEKGISSALKDSSLLFNGKDLDGWEVTNFGTQGPVYVSGGKIILGMGDGCTGITWKKDFPVVNYKVTLDAMRVDGNDFFCGMTFPAGKDPCTLVIGGWGGGTVGLSSINGMDASENETTLLMKFGKNKWYNICLVVKKNEIKVWIDSVQVINFQKGGNRLSIRPEVGLSRPFGIASWTTTAALKNIRVVKNDE